MVPPKDSAAIDLRNFQLRMRSSATPACGTDATCRWLKEEMDEFARPCESVVDANLVHQGP